MTIIVNCELCGYRDLSNKVLHELLLLLKFFQKWPLLPQKTFLGAPRSGKIFFELFVNEL